MKNCILTRVQGNDTCFLSLEVVLQTTDSLLSKRSHWIHSLFSSWKKTDQLINVVAKIASLKISFPGKKSCYSGRNEIRCLHNGVQCSVCLNEWTNECISQRINEIMNERMNEWTNERMNEWMIEGLIKRTNGRTNETTETKEKVDVCMASTISGYLKNTICGWW